MRRAAACGFAVALASGLAGCVSVVSLDSPAFYDLSEERAAPGEPAPHVFMFEKNGATIAVFGTTHLVPDAMKWMSPATEAALKSSDVMLTETSVVRQDEAQISDGEAGALATLSLLPPGRQLWPEAVKRLGPEKTEKIKATLVARGMSPGAYSAMRPWRVCRDLVIPTSARQTATPEDREMIKALMAAHGAPNIAPPDIKVELYGAINGMEIDFLESEYERAENFSRLSDKDGLDCAASIADRFHAPRPGKSIAAQYAELLKMWIDGDVDQARAKVERDQKTINPAWARLFLQGREAAWMPQIKAICEAGRQNCFIAVGLGHLGGPDGLLRLIEAMGYRRIGPQA